LFVAVLSGPGQVRWDLSAGKQRNDEPFPPKRSEKGRWRGEDRRQWGMEIGGRRFGKGEDEE